VLLNSKRVEIGENGLNCWRYDGQVKMGVTVGGMTGNCTPCQSFYTLLNIKFLLV
jgi:hypothetical protein